MIRFHETCLDCFSDNLFFLRTIIQPPTVATLDSFPKKHGSKHILTLTSKLFAGILFLIFLFKIVVILVEAVRCWSCDLVLIYLSRQLYGVRARLNDTTLCACTKPGYLKHVLFYAVFIYVFSQFLMVNMVCCTVQ